MRAMSKEALPSIAMSNEEAAKLLKETRKELRAACKKLIMKLTAPAFSFEVKKTDEEIIISHDKKQYPNFSLIKNDLKNGYCIEQNGHYTLDTSKIQRLCKKYSKKLFEQTGMNQIQAKDNLYFFKFTDEVTPYAFDGDYGFYVYIEAALLRKWEPRVKLVSIKSLRKGLMQELDPTLAYIAHLSGATFVPNHQISDHLNCLTHNPDHYKQAFRDQPKALPWFHLAIRLIHRQKVEAYLRKKKYNGTVNFFSPEMLDLPSPYNAVLWTKNILKAVECTEQVWRYLLNCSPIESVVWKKIAIDNLHIGRHLNNNKKNDGFGLLNLLLAANINIYRPAVIPFYNNFYTRISFAIYSENINLAYFAKSAISACMRYVYEQSKKHKFKKQDINQLINDMGLINLADYIMSFYGCGATEVPVVPKNAGFTWWSRTQRNWHTEQAVITEFKEQQLKNWKGDYLEDIQTIKRSNFIATLLTSAEDYIKEGQVMDHCVGRYIPAAIAGKCLCYAVFNKKTQERATIEISHRGSWTLTQCETEQHQQGSPPLLTFAKHVASTVKRASLNGAILNSSEAC